MLGAFSFRLKGSGITVTIEDVEEGSKTAKALIDSFRSGQSIPISLDLEKGGAL